MALLAVTLDCFVGGFTKVTLCMSAERTGSNNDEYEMRMLRKAPGVADKILPGTPRFVLTPEEDVKTYCWIDPLISVTADHTYILQVRRIEGEGTFNEMTLIAEHFKK
jgi:hypothetical protein